MSAVAAGEPEKLAFVGVEGVLGVVIGPKRSRFTGRCSDATLADGKNKFGGAQDGSWSSAALPRILRLENMVGCVVEPKNASFSESIDGVPAREVPGLEKGDE